MTVFKKNETPLQNIAFMALMAAINVVFTLVSTLLPILFLLLIFVLPLTSVLVTLYCKKRYFIIYAVATIALCLGATFWDLSTTFFYVVPSVISGFLFGILAIKKSPSIFLIIVPTFVQVLFTYISLPIISLIYGFNMIDTFINAFGLKNNPNVYSVVPAFIFLLSLIQASLSYMIIKDELPKFNVVLEENRKYKYIVLIGLLSSLIATATFAIFLLDWAYFALMCSLYFAIYLLFETLNERKIWIYISEGVAFVLTFFIFGIFYSIVGATYGFLLVGVFPLLIGIIAVCNMCLSKRKNKDTITTKEKIDG
ncbi:MAG: hypothetical protein RBR85_02915 [Bacilli bacterium]|jgi:hypothetical protein|nr:hypothetical protein [Bacilli bacterium]